VRELLNNVTKHAAARSVEVAAAAGADGRLRISVRDDGRGFVYERSDRRGFGLFSTERRMAWLGAELEVDSRPGSGTCVTLSLPAR
jgi:signal transduction histidine kinase